VTAKQWESEAARRLEAAGLRVTTQRRGVLRVLREECDHPTAEELFLHARARLPEVSMATVYNTLDALVRCGVVRQVKLDRTAIRYCSNMREHAHFYCEDCGRVFDVNIEPAALALACHLPKHLEPARVEVAMRGHCRGCPRKGRMSATQGQATLALISGAPMLYRPTSRHGARENQKLLHDRRAR